MNQKRNLRRILRGKAFPSATIYGAFDTLRYSTSAYFRLPLLRGHPVTPRAFQAQSSPRLALQLSFFSGRDSCGECIFFYTIEHDCPSSDYTSSANFFAQDRAPHSKPAAFANGNVVDYALARPVLTRPDFVSLTVEAAFRPDFRGFSESDF